MKSKLVIIIIYSLMIIFLAMNIKYRNEKIWQLEVENADLKEQLHRMEVNKNE